MKILKLVLVAVVFAPPVLACDFCAVYTASEALGVSGKGFYAGVAEQYTHFGTLQQDGHEVPNEVGQYLDSSISQIFAGYNFNNRFAVQFNAPLIYRSFRRPEGFAIDQGSESGIGDVFLIGKYEAWRHMSEKSTIVWSLIGGIKFPTGNTDRLKEELNETEVPGAPESGIHGHDLTLGSGSYDGIIGTSFYGRWQRLLFAANGQYSIRTEGDFSYQFADDVNWSGGPGVILALRDEFTLSLLANISGEFKKRDTFQGGTADDTGITSIYVGPEITLTWRDKLSGELGVDLPVSIDNTALQAVPDYRIHAGLTWRF